MPDVTNMNAPKYCEIYVDNKCVRKDRSSVEECCKCNGDDNENTRAVLMEEKRMFTGNEASACALPMVNYFQGWTNCQKL
jgi:hypothetical protein